MDPQPPPPAAAADLSLGPALLSFSLATATFAFSTTFVRFFCLPKTASNTNNNNSIRERYRVDDWGSLVATLVALISTCFTLVESTTFSPIRALEYDVLGQPWYLMSVTFSKIAISLFYMRMLNTSGKAKTSCWRYLLGGLIFVMAVVNFAFALTVNLQCRPLEKIWRGGEVEGRCWEAKVQRDFGFFQGAFGVFTWVFLGGFGVVLGTGLDGSSRDRQRRDWQYWGAFGVCFASGVFAIVRTARTAQTSGLGVYTLDHSYASLMATLEQNLGLIAANVLAFGTLFTSRRGSRQRNLYQSSSSTGTSRSRRTGKSSLSRGGSITRNITRASSRASSHKSLNSNREEGGHGHKRQGHSASVSTLGSFHPDNSHDRYPHDDSHSSDDEGTYFEGEEIDLESGNWWPKGIIKTVSVEVVEEVNVDYVPGNGTNGEGSSSSGGEGGIRREGSKRAGRNSVVIIPPPKARVKKGSVTFEDQTEEGEEMADWEVMIRGGPPMK
ncbi:hypothetical protein QBC40DRAFT_261314 [Triangularia verruculosa]|uniref:Rhodopsin domain-containing protein n=1 Tax=Triangularia verruculosa TaxID=2587418 RepID=A0AAN6XSI1_9PEZI|nr:hypothetical protein QBC40DRAFT_261314 [Triangularia verruculosa]